jgi:cobalt-zinc-cadmium efflux system protein
LPEVTITDGQLQACLPGHLDLEHSTFQLEAAEYAAHEPCTPH